MPRKSAPAVSVDSPFGQLRERWLKGDTFGWPSVAFVAASEDFRAERISWHAHEGHELLILLRGATEYEFQGGHREALSGAHFLIIPPGLRHRGSKDVRGPSVLCALSIDLNAHSSRRSPFSPQELDWLAERFQGAQPVVRSMSPLLRKMSHGLHRAVRQFPAQTPGPEAMASLRLQMAQILLEAARESGETPLRETASLAELAQEFLERHLARDVPMNEVAGHLGCSRSHLYAVFKRETGMSPNDWLLRLRVKTAAELLTGTQLPLIEIGHRAGFSTQAYFCQVFRKYTGHTPGEHRAQR